MSAALVKTYPVITVALWWRQNYNEAHSTLKATTEEKQW